MKRKNIFVATIASDAAEVIRHYSFGIEISRFGMASEMENEDAVKAAEKQLSELGCTERIMHAPFNELHPAAIDPLARDLAKHRYRQAYELADHLGIHRMVVHSGYLPFVYFKEWHSDKSVQFWEEYMSDKPDGMRIYIENVLEDEPYMMAEMMEKIRDDRIGICLDVGHANCMSSVPAEEWVSVLAPYIGHMHLHNNHGSYDDHGPLGDGTIDMEKMFETIEKNCSADMTATLESMDSGSSAEWLLKKGMLDD